MAKDNIKLIYSSNAGNVYSISFEYFVDENIPRATLNQTQVNFAVLGSPYTVGPASRQPNVWTIDALIENKPTSKALKNTTPYNEIRLLKELYAAWDLDRSNGLPAKCTVEDKILEFGAIYSAEAWFTEPPTYTIVGSYSSKYVQVVFGLTEV